MSQTVAFSHPLFVKAHPEQVQQIQMVPKKDKKAASATKKRAKSTAENGHESDESVAEITKKTEYSADSHAADFLVEAALAAGKESSDPRGSLTSSAASTSATFPQLARQPSGDPLRRHLLTEQLYTSDFVHRARPYYAGAPSAYDPLRVVARTTGPGSLISPVNGDILQSLVANRRAADRLSELQDSLLQSMAARRQYQGLGARSDLLPPTSSLVLARERLALQNALLREGQWTRQGPPSYENILSRDLQNTPSLGGAAGRPVAMKRETSSPPVGQERKPA